METFNNYLEAMDHPDYRFKMETILNWIIEKYPMLEQRISYNQLMFVYNGTYILGLSYAKNHIAVSPEGKTMKVYEELILDTGLSHTKNIVRIKWDEPIPYDLIKRFIEFNKEDKKGDTSFWR